jgi:hypothetical protein
MSQGLPPRAMSSSEPAAAGAAVAASSESAPMTDVAPPASASSAAASSSSSSGGSGGGGGGGGGGSAAMDVSADGASSAEAKPKRNKVIDDVRGDCSERIAQSFRSPERKRLIRVCLLSCALCPLLFLSCARRMMASRRRCVHFPAASFLSSPLCADLSPPAFVRLPVCDQPTRKKPRTSLYADVSAVDNVCARVSALL